MLSRTERHMDLKIIYIYILLCILQSSQHLIYILFVKFIEEIVIKLKIYVILNNSFIFCIENPI